MNIKVTSLSSSNSEKNPFSFFAPEFLYSISLAWLGREASLPPKLVDTVRQYLWMFVKHPVVEFSILGGDHLYRMDYQKFIQAHSETNADITVATLPMDEKIATAIGLMKICRKTKRRTVESDECGYYNFRHLLREKFPEENDFGSEVIPRATSIWMGVQAYLYDGYWEDIGTIEAFYNANLGITKKPIPDFRFYDRSSPIYTQSQFLPPSKMLAADATDSVISEEDALLMGVDYYETNEKDLLMSLAGGECPACRDIFNYCGFTPISHKHYKSANVMIRLHQ
eukprot:Gb_25213 [translate_table: standard]